MLFNLLWNKVSFYFESNIEELWIKKCFDPYFGSFYEILYEVFVDLMH